MADVCNRGNNFHSSYSPENRVPVLHKEFVWDEKPKYLKDLLTLSRLPFTAKLHSGDILKYMPPNQSVQDREKNGEILQFLEMRKRKVIVCKKMQWDRKTGDYASSGKRTEVPATYKGWFEVLPENGHPVEYFDSIQAITNVKPRRFLLRTSIVGYQLSIDNGISCWVPQELRPGDVLTTGIIYMDQKKSKSNVRKLFKKMFRSSKSSRKEQELKYLQCFDATGKEIMIPLIMTGVFSPVGEVTEENYDAVYELQDLILAFKLPVNAQLVQEEEQQPRQIVPRGVVKIEEVRDDEAVITGKYPVCGEEDKTFEIPTNADILLKKDLSKKRKSQRKSMPADRIIPPEEQIYANVSVTDVELPVRVKEGKRSRGQGILEKLSVRSKGRKERASLKQLHEEGVFSSRLSRSEINLEDYFKTDETQNVPDSTDNEKIVPATENDSKPATDNSNAFRSSTGFKDSKKGERNSNYLGSDMGENQIQNRDLPPIPVEQNVHTPRDGVYEELPVAPKPPQSIDLSFTYGNHDDDDDGYMCPAQLRMKRSPTTPESSTSGVVRSKPPVAPRDNYTYAKVRKTRIEISPSVENPRYSDFDFDDLFNFSGENENPYLEGDVASLSSKQTYQTTVNAQTKRHSSYPYDTERKFMDDLVLENGAITNWAKVKSRSHRSLIDANVTVRSHNMRKMRNVMDVFDSENNANDIARPYQGHDQISKQNYASLSATENRFSAIENPRLSQYELPGSDRRSIYAASEPGYRRYPRALSTSGLSEIYGNGRGDDSAISGDYGYHGDSEYSYNEYSDFRDDGWRPPTDLSGLSVQEVSKSLRYIGMKDRVVIRLSNEQIDGQLLCSLDKKLLQEGFPELNALEIKKIIDFINGWRPKK